MQKRSKKIGMSPGTLVHLGEQKKHEVGIELIRYSPDVYGVTQAKNLSEFQLNHQDLTKVDWVHFNGIHDTRLIEQLGQTFGIHGLVLEDIVNANQRPKAEEYDDFFFVVLQMPTFHTSTSTIKYEQLSLVLKPPFVISLVEDPGDLFDSVRGHIQQGKGRIRKMGADYLAYALIDCVVDNHFIVMENMSDMIETLEQQVIGDPKPAHLKTLYKIKRELLFLRKSLWGSREALGLLYRNESKLISKEVRFFLRDVYDHLIYMMDTLETYRDIVSGILEIYLSSQSNRMNEIMKVLTIIATLFIPLTFIVGIYGMNFENMPEIHSRYGYASVWGIMITLTMIMLAYFRKRKWM
ncbi:MAG: hypothetical protein ACD_73C00729G0001 [uncultured bacterium]|nr:MAG: hypothetical protein ACD_73C00729G0001 [uncultured bacterium]